MGVEARGQIGKTRTNVEGRARPPVRGGTSASHKKSLTKKTLPKLYWNYSADTFHGSRAGGASWSASWSAFTKENRRRLYMSQNRVGLRIPRVSMSR